MPKPSPIGINVYTARKNAGLSQIELAFLAGINNSTICHLERGQTQDIMALSLHKIAVALSVSMDSLMVDPYTIKGGNGEDLYFVVADRNASPGCVWGRLVPSSNLAD